MVAAAAKLKIQEIEEFGGAMTAIEAGWQQREIHEAAWSHLKAVENEERKIVGVNYAILESEENMTVLKIDSKLAKKQNDKLAEIRNSRDSQRVDDALQSIRNASANDDNLFPLVIDALKVNCTLGEIMDAMKDEFGTWMAPSGF